MKFLSVISYTAVIAAFVVGCGNEHTPPPSERNDLVLRFFNSMKNEDYKSAAEQGIKLRTMDPGNDFLSSLIIIQQNNAFLKQVQSKLNSGDLDGAIAVLDQGIAVYPLHRDLNRTRGMLVRLRNTRRLFRAMTEAKTARDMTAALSAANNSLAHQLTPELKTYFAAYQKRIDEQRKKEQPIMPAVPQPIISHPSK